jgi:hypothetical protein
VLLGRVFSRLGKSYLALGYALPVLLIGSLVMSRYATSLAFVPPFYWITASRARFVILSLAATTGLTTPLSRLPRRSEKLIVCVLMVVVVAWFSVMPFLVPALMRDKLSGLETHLDSNGVCFQSTDFTCAPAAAVTALRQLGLTAQEGEIAVLSRTSPIAGTLPGCLGKALEFRYGDAGLSCRYRYFDSVAELEEAGLTLAVIKDTFMCDHCVAVLEVSGQTVTVADPVVGRRLISRERFEKLWRYTGLVLKMDSARSI